MSIKNTLVALALVLPATAGPVLEGRGNRISSQRRYHLDDDNGRFDHSRAARQVVRDHKLVTLPYSTRTFVQSLTDSTVNIVTT